MSLSFFQKNFFLFTIITHVKFNKFEFICTYLRRYVLFNFYAILKYFTTYELKYFMTWIDYL